MRQDIHRRIAEALEAQFPSLIEAQPEIAAHHFGEALQVEKAVAYWHRVGQVSVAKSAVREADTQLRRGLGLLRSLPESDERKRRELAFRYGQDVGATALCYLAWALWHNGYLAQATLMADRAIRHAREFGHAHTIVYTLWHAATVSLFARDAVRVAALANEVVAISAEHGFAMWLAYGNIFVGWAAAQRGEIAAGLARMRAGIAASAATGAQLFEPLFLGLLAEGLALDGSAAQALAQLDEAAAAAARTGNAAAVADLCRLRGVVLQSLGTANDDGAEAAFTQAIAEARRQGSRFYELRAATSLARLWRDQGRDAEARDLLAPIHGWFTDGFDTPDLKEAKALLDKSV